MSTKMKLTRWGLYKSVVWTTGAFGAGQFVRLIASVILTRLLSPELFGIMTIINSIRTGVDLITDVGVGQNIVQSKNAEDPDFYNTAWTLKSLRGICLWLVCTAAALPVAHFYKSPIMGALLPVAALWFVSEGFTSISFALMQKRLKITELNVLTFLFELIPAAVLVILAYFYRSIWALIVGLLIASVIRMTVSFFLLADVRLRFWISKKFTTEILHFGKWIFLSSIVYFLSTNFDRLYLGKLVPLGLLGVYGVASSIAGMVVALVARLCGLIVFPYISASAGGQREKLRTRLSSVRPKLLFGTALGLAALAAVGDFPVTIIYDARYHAAAGMLPILLLGVWFSILCNVNESVLLGYGRPQFIAAGNIVKFSWLLVGMPPSFAWHGFLGIILVIAAGDLFRYFPVLVGQIRIRVSFVQQDLLMTLAMFSMFGLFVWLRWALGLGVSFSNLFHSLQ
jgi:O-antigen/teichoic acid export membrane protein